MAYKILNQNIPAPHGQLETVTFVPENYRDVMIISHPHPQHGGTMHNKVVFSMAEVARKCNFLAVRYNFRGVGKSTGSYGDGMGEIEDLETVINHVVETYEFDRLILAGFSFGARVTLELLRKGTEPFAALLVGLPLAFFNIQQVSNFRFNFYMIQGDRDEYSDPETAKLFLDQCDCEKGRFEIVEGADHFFNGKIHVFKEKISNYLEVVRNE